MRIREAVPGDGTAIASIHRATSSYYVGLDPELFRIPDQDGFVEFVEPDPDDNSPTSLLIVAEVDDEVVGDLYAVLIEPVESDRFQSSSDVNEVRLFIHSLAVLPAFWRRGVATALVEHAEAWGRRQGATIALCDTWPDSPVSLPFWQRRMRYETREVRLRKRLTT